MTWWDEMLGLGRDCVMTGVGGKGFDLIRGGYGASGKCG